MLVRRTIDVCSHKIQILYSPSDVKKKRVTVMMDKSTDRTVWRLSHGSYRPRYTVCLHTYLLLHVTELNNEVKSSVIFREFSLNLP